MALIRRTWTAESAEEWTKEDWIAIVISPLAYILLTVGVALSILMRPIGYLLLIIGIIATIAMHWIIDPKLKEISTEYEKKQKDYLADLDRRVKWKELL
ncbi:hypothetical protein ACFL6E_03985 [Candidatus Neomarinimicrobiota bacterium]